MIEFIVPVKTVGGLNAREHWAVRAKRVKVERKATVLSLVSAKRPRMPCVVTMTRLSAGTLDGDNLQGACKAIRDGVADWLGCADNNPNVTWRYAQERTHRGHYGVRVRIEAAP